MPSRSARRILIALLAVLVASMPVVPSTFGEPSGEGDEEQETPPPPSAAEAPEAWPENPAETRWPSDVPRAIELVGERAEDMKVYLLPDGSRQAMFAAGMHYEDEYGFWREVDPTFRPSGEEWTADRADVEIEISGQALAAVDDGGGIRWLFENPVSVETDRATVVHEGVTWSYFPTSQGPKAIAPIGARRGAHVYDFPYQLIGGGSLTTNDDGSLRGPGFAVPRAFAVGADGAVYPASPWTVDGAVASFTFDDSALPDAALPYDLDPTTEFNIAATPDDSQVFVYHQRSTPSVAEIAAARPDPVSPISGASKECCVGETYGGVFPRQTRNAFVKWNTSTLPRNAVISSATTTLLLDDVRSYGLSRYVAFDWCCSTPTPGAESFSFNGEGGTAAYRALVSFSSYASNTISLNNPDFWITRTGQTSLRLAIANGSAGVEPHWILFRTANSLPQSGSSPRLTVNYTCDGGCDIDDQAGVHNNGDSPHPTNTTISLVDPSWTAHKLAILAQASPGVAYNMAVLATTTPNLSSDTTQGAPAGCPDGSCIPSRKSIPTRNPILKQERDYWCGPASVQNVLLWMTGDVSSHTQANLSAEMSTETFKATYWVDMRRELNERQNLSKFIGSHPHDGDGPIANPTDLMQRVSATIHYDNTPAILNVDTVGLEYYHGYSTKHFNMAFGYDHAGGGYIKIADEYDPTMFGYSLRPFGNTNPYGHHPERVTSAYAAVKANKSLIIW